MLYREAGQYKTNYAADVSVFPLREDRIGLAIIIVCAYALALTGNGFLLQAAHPLRVSCKFGRQRFKSHRSPCVIVPGLVKLAHSATADMRLDSVTTDLLADKRCD